MRILRFFCCLFLYFVVPLVQAEEPQALRLFSRENIAPLNFSLPDSDWRWLGEKQEVKIAVYSPENPPFDLVPDSHTYEGISADYSMIIMRHLGLRFQILRFSNRSEAMQALRQGKADMLIDDGGGLKRNHPGLLSSSPFMPDHPALISRETVMSKPMNMRPDVRIAMVSEFLNDKWVTSRYPNAKVTRYGSTQSALTSVELDENDYFIGNLAPASFLIERNYATTLSIANIYQDIDTGPRFLFRDTDTVLQHAVDTVLKSVSPEQHMVIFHHWTQGPNLWLFQSHLPLTDKEKRWLVQHRELRVVMTPLYAPFSLYDSQKQFQGISADVLRLIHLRTGLNFKAVEFDTVPEMFNAIRQHQGELLAVMSASPQREKELLFTRPYMQPPFVMVVRNTLSAPKEISQASVIAIVPDNVLKTSLKNQYPELKLIEVENASVAMKLVSEGKADGAINNLISARYMIDRYFRGELKIATRLGEEPSKISFAVGRDQPELLSILNKALADIPPREISLIANKWQGTPDIKIDTWSVYRSEFYWLAGIFTVLVITSLIWNYYLRREIVLRKDVQVRLQQQATFLETLFNGTPVPVYVVNREGGILNRNSAWEHFFSLTPEAMRDLPLTAAQHPLAEIWNALSADIDTPKTGVTFPQVFRINNGAGMRSIVHQAVPFKDKNGQIAGLICSWQDTTEHEQLLMDVLASRERAEQANRSKSTFLATMSHEIRTPISAIIGLLELAATDKESKEANAESVRVAYESAQSLMGLIGDILDMAKIESGKLELMPEWVRFDTLVTPVVHVFMGLARQNNLLLRSQVDVLHPDEILIDPMRLRQILSNLVSNAIKFTEQGAVEIWVNCVADKNGRATLEIIVTDTGVGISQDEQRDIFDPYIQSESGKTQSGTGLGLAICRQLVTMMKGDIALNSQPGRGTRITVRIPVECRENSLTQESHAEIIPAVEMRPLKILAVDDHPANRLLLKRQLTHLGHQVTGAENGELALALYQESAFELVITDCNMPVMNGLELTRRLRQVQKTPLTVLGLTANAQPEERVRCMTAGMDDCLFKPLQLSQLETLLNRIPRQAPTPPALLSSLVDIQALKTLAQNDDVLFCAILQTTLTENIRDLQQAKLIFDAKSWSDLVIYAHRLAGAAQIVGATDVERTCRELENYLENTPDDNGVSARFEEAVNAVSAFNHAVEYYLSSFQNKH